MADLKTSPLDRLYLVGAIRRMGERTGAAAERIIDDLDTLRAENAKLRAVAEAARAAVDMVDEEEPRDALRRALAALEAP